MSYYEPDGKGSLVPARDVPDEAIREIERYDDETIVRTMTSGAAAEAYIYRYTIQTATGPKEIIGISTEGSYELANEMGNLEVLNDAKVDKDSDPDYIYVMLRVKNSVRGTILLGVGRACKYQIGKGNLPDRSRLDEHAFVKAVSKAQRNGILHHADENLIARIVEWAKKGKSARIGPPPVTPEQKRVAAPAPVPKAATQAAPTPAPKASAQTKAPASSTQSSAAPAPAQTTQPDTSALAAAVAAQQQKLAELRTKIHGRFINEVKIDESTIRSLLEQRFGDGELSRLSEAQLSECNDLIDEAIRVMSKPPEPEQTQEPVAEAPAQPPAPAPAQATTETPGAISLGFQNDAEQTKLRGHLYSLLTKPENLGMSKDQALEFVSARGYKATNIIPKETLTAFINEATEMVEMKKTGPSEDGAAF